jgi:hypothetical protein
LAVLFDADLGPRLPCLPLRGAEMKVEKEVVVEEVKFSIIVIGNDDCVVACRELGRDEA